MSEPTRPILRWYGGKWLLASWIIEHFPPHRIYVEAFGGAASVLLQKQRSYAEIYNDLDGSVVNLFRMLRERPAEVTEMIRLTPFSREEFELAYEPSTDSLERARRLLIRSFMGFGSNSHNPELSTGFRANANCSGTVPAHDWEHFPDAVDAVIERMRGVVIENRCALRVTEHQDSPETLHYLDPPYVMATRGRKKKSYVHEMDEEQHCALLGHALGLKGMVVISGYSHPIYEDALSTWQRVERESFADGARPRIEVLWLNPRAWAAARAAGKAFVQERLL